MHVMMLCIKVLIFLGVIRVRGSVHFAIYQGRLYADILGEFEDRGTTTLYGLLQLINRYPIPDVHGTLGECLSSHGQKVCLGSTALPSTYTMYERAAYPYPSPLPPDSVAVDDLLPPEAPWGNWLSFWRPAGAKEPHLWPDHDFWGWGYAWIAPLDFISGEVLSSVMVPEEGAGILSLVRRTIQPGISTMA